MSQTVVVAPPDAAPDVAGGPGQPSQPSRLAAGLAALRHALRGSPGRLRLVSATCVLACLLAGVIGGYALQRRSAALSDARGAATHLVLLQTVQTQLVEADAAATNGYLKFGLEPIENQQRYLAAMSAGSRGLAEAAKRSAERDSTLAGVNADVTRYAGFISSARADNRAQRPGAGPAYLTAASNLMRTQIIPALQRLAAADSRAIDDNFARAGNARWWLVFAAVLGLGALVGGQYYLTRHSRRAVNLPAAGATAGLAVVLLAAAVTMSGAQGDADDVRSGDLARAIAISDARVAAFDAKSLESLTLVSPGSYAAYEPLWKEASEQAVASIGRGGVPAAGAALAAYRVQHERIRSLDQTQNKRTAAIDLARSTTAGSANGTFDAFAAASSDALRTRAAAASDGLSDAGDLLVPIGLLVLLVGVLAAVAAWYGVSQRLDEYR